MEVSKILFHMDTKFSSLHSRDYNAIVLRNPQTRKLKSISIYGQMWFYIKVEKLSKSDV